MKNINDLIDEQFCLSYELKILSTRINLNKQERWLPGFTDSITDFDHQQRYDWATQFVKNKSVLDIACGTGKGSYIMANEGARYVIGCDIEEDAVRYSSIKYKHENLQFQVQDATKYRSQKPFDVIISFETIEHINNTQEYLETMNQNLDSNGLYIVSTPIATIPENFNPKNSFHVIEWGFNKFQEVISSKFKIKKVYLQLHEKRPYSFIENKINRFFPKKQNYRNTKIEEFSPKTPTNKLGKQLNGYQILVCTKKVN
jgi:2-polyprenyl-3-methyl-5-hydroxy-6-metoxy-1,4-benzoquinol methylase